MSTPMTGPVRDLLRATISNAYYEARNAGRTMEDAADEAVAGIERELLGWGLAIAPAEAIDREIIS